MKSSRRTGTTVALTVAAMAITACTEATSTNRSALQLGANNAFVSAPAGYSQLTSSFSTDNGGSPFEPQFDDHGGPGGPGGPGGGHGDGDQDGRGPGGPGGFGFGLGGRDMMGGGLGGAFFGDGLGAGFGRGPFGDGGLHEADCAFSSSGGLTTCDDTIRGLTVVRTAQYLDASGTAQSKVDSTTNTIKTTTTVSGTVTRRDSSTSTINETSKQAVAGLAKGSAKRTVDGVSGGTEATAGTSPQGAFNALRTVGDTVSGVVIPVDSTGRPTYPTAGTVIRAMTFAATVNGSTTTSTRREVVTYDGSATATVTITQDGTTKHCTLPLPRGRLSCQ